MTHDAPVRLTKMEEGGFLAERVLTVRILRVCVCCLIAQVHSGCRCRSHSAAKRVEAKDAHVNSFNAVLVI